MKPALVVVVIVCCLALVGTPMLGAWAGMEGEGARELERAVERHLMERTTVLHHAAAAIAPSMESLVETPPVAHVVHTEVAPHVAGPATSHALTAALVTAGIALVFIALVVYDLTHPGPPPFEGQEWDTCANAQHGTAMARQCHRHGFLSRG